MDRKFSRGKLKTQTIKIYGNKWRITNKFDKYVNKRMNDDVSTSLIFKNTIDL